MSHIVRYTHGGVTRLGVLRGSSLHALPLDDMAAALRLRAEELRAIVDSDHPVQCQLREADLLAPVDRQEVWAAGVTYRRSREARLEESAGADVYEKVYAAARPELFFKSPGWRVVADGGAVGVRADSGWNLPEPELAVIVNVGGEIVGYTAGNDVSSRDIEGANALYLPQAKVYDRSCALGPGIRPAWELPPAPDFGIELAIRRNGVLIADGATSTAQMKRTPSELVTWLRAALDFPDGVVLLTGTGIVPTAEVSLQAGDDVTVRVTEVGELRNHVISVGSGAPAAERLEAAR